MKLRKIKNKKSTQSRTDVASLFSSKKGAMEMSMGTIVTIVLLMSVLILGLVMVKSIFKSSKGAISGIDNAMQNEMSKMFSDDEGKKVILYPKERMITLKKGDDNLGFGIFIRNTETEDSTFTYEITAQEPSHCGTEFTSSKAESLIILGRKDTNGIIIQKGNIIEDPIFVRFKIPDNAPPCLIRYNVDVKRNGEQYGSTKTMDVQIKSK